MVSRAQLSFQEAGRILRDHDSGSQAEELVELRAGSARALIHPQKGGMLISLRVGGHELLKQAEENGRGIPRFGSFILAPWVGELYEGLLQFRGHTYRLPMNVGRHAVHGLVFSGAWTLAHAAASSATLERKLEEPWPFGGLVRQQLTLTDDGISLVVEVHATQAAMPASIGWHPWFHCPEPHTTRVLVRADQRLELDDELIPTGRLLDVAGMDDLRIGPVLGEREIDNVYVDAVSPAVIDLPSVRLSIAFDDQTSIVVVYTSQGSVCVEPWSSWPDASRMSERGYPSGLTILEPGEVLRRQTTWSWRGRVWEPSERNQRSPAIP
jgi:aldose 1-epimerase